MSRIEAGRSKEKRNRSHRGLARVVVAALLICTGVAAVVCARAISRVQPVAITFGQATVILKEYPDQHANARQQIHEAVHRLQYREHGLVRFLAAYFFDQDRRLAWEAEALAATLCYSRSREANRLDQLTDAAVEGLRLYWVAGQIPRRRASTHIQRAYREGGACAGLLRRLASADAGLIYVLRNGSSAAD